MRGQAAGDYAYRRHLLEPALHLAEELALLDGHRRLAGAGGRKVDLLPRELALMGGVEQQHAQRPFPRAHWCSQHHRRVIGGEELEHPGAGLVPPVDDDAEALIDHGRKRVQRGAGQSLERIECVLEVGGVRLEHSLLVDQQQRAAREAGDAGHLVHDALVDILTVPAGREHLCETVERLDALVARHQGDVLRLHVAPHQREPAVGEDGFDFHHRVDHLAEVGVPFIHHGAHDDPDRSLEDLWQVGHVVEGNVAFGAGGPDRFPLAEEVRDIARFQHLDEHVQGEGSLLKLFRLHEWPAARGVRQEPRYCIEYRGAI